MKLSECSVETNNISNLSDKPAMIPTELKREFDKAATGIKRYINETLTKEIEQEFEKKVPTSKDSRLITKTEIDKLAGIEEGATKIKIVSGTADPREIQDVLTDVDYYIQVFEEEE